jgi:hypothetical protein
MNSINAKELFQNSATDYKGAISEMAKSPALRVSVIYAMAELASRGATHEQLAGARAFVDILINLGEPIEPPRSFPDKTLKHI